MQLLHSIGAPALAGIPLIDVGVGLFDDFTRLTQPDSSLGELIQAAFPLTPVVKTLCTMDSTTMTAPGDPTEPGTVFLSGDDAEAKRITGLPLTDLGRPASSQLDIGSITTARGQEHFAFRFMGIAGGVGSHTFNIKVVTRPAARQERRRPGFRLQCSAGSASRAGPEASPSAAGADGMRNDAISPSRTNPAAT